ncbi:hypothetical protein AURDEDRAFT_177833 [Auricularia subglabra TFB-10046 SS5]|uniref:Uncharacterized protein n=1 Tax=Auricularia subglabra (strain TFB-10046 / SS5) TaxID=717982 RepID=J0D345_AURST|nr:hypothetical protein AURDEDRAFT_177833 [Auricularia subglabra TFB-10046 SS5]
MASLPAEVCLEIGLMALKATGVRDSGMTGRDVLQLAATSKVWRRALFPCFCRSIVADVRRAGWLLSARSTPKAWVVPARKLLLAFLITEATPLLCTVDSHFQFLTTLSIVACCSRYAGRGARVFYTADQWAAENLLERVGTLSVAGQLERLCVGIQGASFTLNLSTLNLGFFPRLRALGLCFEGSEVEGLPVAGRASPESIWLSPNLCWHLLANAGEQGWLAGPATRELGVAWIPGHFEVMTPVPHVDTDWEIHSDWDTDAGSPTDERMGRIPRETMERAWRGLALLWLADFCMDENVLSALSNLRSLVRLDLHPAEWDVGCPRRGSECACKRERHDPAALAIRALLPALPALSVLHVGLQLTRGGDETCPTFWRAVWEAKRPALRFVGLGPCWDPATGTTWNTVAHRHMNCASCRTMFPDGGPTGRTDLVDVKDKHCKNIVGDCDRICGKGPFSWAGDGDDSWQWKWVQEGRLKAWRERADEEDDGWERDSAGNWDSD